MGGGDLNSKKSWHPNTIKNQERVWKAEQAVAEEKKRIMELQRERAEERDRTELNDMIKNNSVSSSNTNDNRLHWMYDKPDKSTQQEEYLLGKTIDKNDPLDKAEPDVIPAVARRVVGSSMLTTAGDSQVDLARKIREDPLQMVKERERAARAALLNNPLQRRRLTELLRKEQEQRKENKMKKKTKKQDKDLDEVLATKLNALGEKGVDLAALLASDDDSTSDSSSEDKPKKRKKSKKEKKPKKKAKKKKKKKKYSSESDTEKSDHGEKETHKRNRSKDRDNKHKTSSKKMHKSLKTESRKQDSKESSSENEVKTSKRKRDRSSRDRSQGDKRKRHLSSSDDTHSKHTQRSLEQSKRRDSPRDAIRMEDRQKYRKREGLSEKERAARLQAMAAAGAEREIERGRRVAEQRVADANADRPDRPRALVRNEARVLPDSLESRIHSNRHYIQRDRRHMNEHFARR